MDDPEEVFDKKYGMSKGITVKALVVGLTAEASGSRVTGLGFNLESGIWRWGLGFLEFPNQAKSSSTLHSQISMLHP